MNVYKLIEIYLDYRNNFLTIKGYADYYNLDIKFTEVLILEATKTYKGIYG